MIQVTAETFEKEVLQSEIPVLVDFFATWCGPCKMFAPILEDFAAAAEGKVKVCKVDIDQELPLAQKYNIMSVPTILVFQSGVQTASNLGVVEKEKLAQLAGISL